MVGGDLSFGLDIKNILVFYKQMTENAVEVILSHLIRFLIKLKELA